jgi:hypothetical protein
MSFVPENPLEETLLQATTSSTARRDFFRLLLASDVLVVGEKADDGRLKIVISERDGKKYISIFTSPTRLKNHAQTTVKTLTLAGRMLFERTRGVTVLVNPSDEHPAELTPAMIAQILDARDSPFKTTLN